MHSHLAALALSCILVAGPAFADDLRITSAVPPSALFAATPDEGGEPFWFPWQGMLIGSAAGAGVGYLWGRATCTGGGFFPCSTQSAFGAISGILPGLGLGVLVQWLIQRSGEGSSSPSRPLGDRAPALFLPSVTVGETTSLNLALRF